MPFVRQNMCRGHFLLSDHFFSVGDPSEAHATSINHHRSCVRFIYISSLFACSRTPASGMMGQYPFAAFIGKILDYYGAWMCSLISACLYLAGFGLFANEISKSSNSINQSSVSTFYNLVILFFVAGLATVCSCVDPPFSACVYSRHFIKKSLFIRFCCLQEFPKLYRSSSWSKSYPFWPLTYIPLLYRIPIFFVPRRSS